MGGQQQEEEEEEGKEKGEEWRGVWWQVRAGAGGAMNQFNSMISLFWKTNSIPWANAHKDLNQRSRLELFSN